MTDTEPDPIELTSGFLRSLALFHIDEALAVVGEDILYENVGLPAVRGKKQFRRAMRAFNSGPVRFDAEILHAAVRDGIVLNERIDVLSIGPLRLRFWVCGRFEVRDGQIVVWRDYFDFFDCTKAVVRGLIGLVIPSAVKPINSLTRGSVVALPGTN
ncbi:nuclear transport factor 2 family protein [Gordonia sp. X0973]|uniref:limonene-1,2-epoxide hydrolase family protein n=1 Tax=Gordonia sp. X0973 TaxID=2742602 RepID=UPI000F52E6E1|nr:limonene-1,2-epoxide hydrolase family protein [Gordonia sp. X0973]QKT06518.1 nuclear transport factor 2 family protein [Gordonia sp. X0973]